MVATETKTFMDAPCRANKTTVMVSRLMFAVAATILAFSTAVVSATNSVSVQDEDAVAPTTSTGARIRRQQQRSQQLREDPRHLATTTTSGDSFLDMFRMQERCRKVDGSSTASSLLYTTVTMRPIMGRMLGRDIGVPGRCSTVCNQVCKHEPCVDDYVDNGDSLCECLLKQTTKCGPNAQCSNDTETCICSPGYQGNAITGCIDKDECAQPGSSVCGNTGLICSNTVGSYSCTCRQGYTFVNDTCVDLDECLTIETSCGGKEGTKCTNTIGSYSCSCDAGFSGRPPAIPCYDINDCRGYPCSPYGFCRNLPGTYMCDCNPGFRSLAPNGGCVEIDECAEAIVNRQQLCDVEKEICQNIIANYTCVCKPGYNGTRGNCIKVTDFGPYEKCNSNADCSDGLTCATKSRSDSSLVCCASTSLCKDGIQRCCSGAYTEGQECASKLDIDCRDNLKCAQRGLFDSTHICCTDTYRLGSTRICGPF